MVCDIPWGVSYKVWFFLLFTIFMILEKPKRKTLDSATGGGGMTALGDCDTVSKPGMTFMGGIPGLKA